MFDFIVMIIIVILVILCYVMTAYVLPQRREKIIKENIEKLKLEKNFIVSKEIIDSFKNFSIVIDRQKNQWALITSTIDDYRLFEFSDLIKYEVVKDVERTVHKGKETKTCNKIEIKLTLNTEENAHIDLALFPSKLETSIDMESSEYHRIDRKLKEFCSIFKIIKSGIEYTENLSLEGKVILCQYCGSGNSTGNLKCTQCGADLYKR